MLLCATTQFTSQVQHDTARVQQFRRPHSKDLVDPQCCWHGMGWWHLASLVSLCSPNPQTYSWGSSIVDAKLDDTTAAAACSLKFQPNTKYSKVVTNIFSVTCPKKQSFPWREATGAASQKDGLKRLCRFDLDIPWSDRLLWLRLWRPSHSFESSHAARAAADK